VHDRPGLEALGQRLPTSFGGEEDDGDVFQARVFLDLAADHESVHLRHHHVEENEIEGVAGQDLQRFGSPTGGGDLEALLLQDRALEVQDVLVVVDYEYTFRHPALKLGGASGAPPRPPCSLRANESRCARGLTRIHAFRHPALKLGGASGAPPRTPLRKKVRRCRVARPRGLALISLRSISRPPRPPPRGFRGGDMNSPPPLAPVRFAAPVRVSRA